MISLSTLVYLVLFLLGAALILGLLHYLVSYCEAEIGGNPLIYKAARIALVVLAVLLLIGVILDFMGQPIVRWR